jgi:hypothetical protein
MGPVESVLGIGGGDNKEEWWRGEFKYDVFDTLKGLL